MVKISACFSIKTTLYCWYSN